MDEHQADKMIDLLSDIKDELSRLADRLDEVESRMDSFRGLAELAETMTEGGWFTGSFAERVGEQFNEGVTNRLDVLCTRSEAIYDKLEELNANISNS